MESQQKAGSQQRTKPFIRSPKGHRDCFHKGGSLLAESYKNCCYSIRGSSHSLTTFGLSCIISSGTAQEPFCDHLQAGLMRIPQGVLCCTKAKAARDPTAHSQHWRSNTRYLPFNSVLTSKLGHRRETAQPLSSISIKEQLHTLQENAQILAVLHKRGS